jgi:hypothetical protein
MLQEYLLGMEKDLPGLLAGFYVHGSLALGAFNWKAVSASTPARLPTGSAFSAPWKPGPF